MWIKNLFRHYLIDPVETDFGPGAAGASDPNVPGIPIFQDNNQFRITSSNDVMVFDSSESGSNQSIDVDDGYYTGTALAAELTSEMNGNGTLTGGTITFTVTYSTTTVKFTITASTGTIQYIDSGSDAGDTFGFTADTAVAASIISDTPTEPIDTITFDFSANGNDDTVTYSIYDNTQASYIDGNGDTAGETFLTRANWNNGGQAGRVTVDGLSQDTVYTYKTKAKSTLGVESAESANSADMYTNTLVDWGTASDEIEREVPTGDTKIKLNGVTDEDGETHSILIADTASSGTPFFGGITMTFVLQNNYETDSRVALKFSEDQTNYSAGTDFFTVTSANDILQFTSSEGGPVNVDVPDSAYADGDAMATALETAMNGETVLTGSGTITFTVAYSSSTGKYTITLDTGTLELHFFNSDGAYTFGFTDNKTAASSLVSDESRGESPRVLTTSATGVQHTVVWDSYTDSGRSEKDTTVDVRLTPADASPSGGDDGEPVDSATFSLDNTPAQLTLLNSDGFAFDKDTTPAFTAIMGNVRGGSLLFFRLTLNASDDTNVLTKDSSSAILGWEYQQSGSGYTQVPITGVPGQYIDGANLVRYTIQAGDALTQDNDDPYKVTIEQGEDRHRG